MIRELFGSGSIYATLRDGLDESTRTHRRIANRVANTTNAIGSAGFASELSRQQQSASARNAEADLEGSMTRLADNQIRFDATARLLQRAYSQIRTALKNG
jgi:flagellar basal body rod protein FlgB